ncbi:hypothetical protein U1Q18_025886 [Sarracenia purpurea var. burkii]
MPASSLSPQPSLVGTPVSNTPYTAATASDDQGDHASASVAAQEKDFVQGRVDALIAGLNRKPPVHASSPAASSQERPSSRINKTFERKKKPPKDIHINTP